ncbi:alpha/beta hydrolase [Hyphococcus flavus]|uniref:Alpha/beta hydrolase n=1 Tax=Hyphococcus flavus TaxID=1866326 RepID=A0AAE9ZAM3_9PROT|nr:alpha/beta hydrolase [Hyphococcus flavus]WDI30226.1 alpha/beta hydrolase [Hyphococcus flavus]
MIPVDKWREEARRMEFSGHSIAWWTSADPNNEKPWLLLIHGFPTSSWDWSGMWPELAQHFNLAALDMLGFGLSDKPTNIKYSIFNQADLQEALLEHFSVSEAHLFVHDYGNTVAQELLARANEKSLSFAIKSIVFLNGGLFPEQHRARPIQKLALTPLGPLLGSQMSRNKLRKAFDGIFGVNTKATDEEIDAHWSLFEEGGGKKIFHKLMQYIPERKANRERWVGALQETHIPMRLIDGGADPVSGKHMYEHYLELVPNADAILFEDIGHYPHTEAPDRVTHAFFDFHRKLGTVKP